MQIKTNRLLLRPLSIDDLEIFHQYASDKEGIKYMLFFPVDTKAESEQILLTITNEWQRVMPYAYEFAVTLDNKHIGCVSIHLNEQRTEGELAWILNKDYRGNGYITEAALALKDFAINTLKIKRIIANCDYRNTASYTVMQKIGLTLEDDTGHRQYPKTLETARELLYSLILTN